MDAAQIVMIIIFVPTVFGTHAHTQMSYEQSCKLIFPIIYATDNAKLYSNAKLITEYKSALKVSYKNTEL